MSAYKLFEKQLLLAADGSGSKEGIWAKNILASNESMGGYSDALSVHDKSTIGRIFNNVSAFLGDKNLINHMDAKNLNKLTSNITTINSSESIATIGVEDIKSLVHSCGIKPKHQHAAALTFANAFDKLQTYGGQGHALAQHNVVTTSMEATSLNTIFSNNVVNRYGKQEFAPSVEAFGANIDQMMPDVRMVLSIAIMKFHHGILNRIMHRIPTTSTLISYLASYVEIYDYHSASNISHEIRQGSAHRKPMIDLYLDGSIVNAKLKRIEPLLVNDTTGKFMVSDGVIKLGVEVPLFDMALKNNTPGYDNINFTDLVSEGVILEKLFVKIEFKSVSEIFAVDIKNEPSARLTLTQNSNDSGDRACSLGVAVVFNSSNLTSGGVASQIFAGVVGDEAIHFGLRAAATINLKTSLTSTMAQGTLVAYHKNKDKGAVPSAGTIDIADNAIVTFVGYSIDARYSEENMRKSTTSAVLNHYQKAFEMPAGMNVMIDYSLQQTLPETLMASVNELISVGQDDRAVDIIEDTLKYVYDRMKQEKNMGNLLVKDRVAVNYAAGMTVRPSVWMGKVDPTKALSIRSSDVYGDIRNYCELEFMKIMSLLMTQSYYGRQLDPNEMPTFAVITSPVIMDLVFGVPHIHDKLQKMSEGETDGKVIEHIRVLPSNIQLNCISTSFKKLRNKIIIIPFRANNPESELNFGHNWDYGTMVANYTNNMQGGAVDKRVFASARELPVPTNPIGAIVEVVSLDVVMDMFEI